MFSSTTSLLLAGLAGLSTVQAALVEHWWNITYVDNVNPDGRYPRRVTGVNGSWPLPLLNVNASDTLRIHVTNGLGDGNGTSLHGHGMFFNGTGYMDGATHVTQCPIPPGETFTYDMLNSPDSPNGTAKQWGTFWTHGHALDQYVDGLRTASIIHADTTDTQAYEYDDDYTIFLSDWYWTDATTLRGEFMNEANPTGIEPIPQSPLVYIAHTSNVSSEAGWLAGFNENATLTFEAGKTYRLRLINGGAFAMFHWWIDGHELDIIEVDGVDTERFTTDAIVLAVAQRYSVLVTAKNTTTVNYYMHSNMDPDMFDTVPDTTILNMTSTIQYTSDSSATFADQETKDYNFFDDTQLVPFYAATPPPPTASRRLDISFDTRSNGMNYASFNNISFITPETPSLLTMQSMGTLGQDAVVYGPDSSAMVLNHLESLDLHIFNWDAGSHPLHLHGHQVSIVHRSMDASSDDATLNPAYDPLNISSNPIRRDVWIMPSVGYAVLRVTMDNPGAWMLHCHIQWHMDAGFVGVLIEAQEIINDRVTLPSYVTDQCTVQGTSLTGNAGGVNSTTDFGTLAEEVPYLESGWNGKAVGSIVGCAVTAFIGLTTMVIYGLGKGEGEEDGDDDDEAEAEAEGQEAEGDRPKVE